MKKTVLDINAVKATSAWIFTKDGQVIGKMISYYGNTGKVTLKAWDWTEYGRSVEGTAGGGGYDKVDAIMEGQRLFGVLMSNSWEYDLETAGIKVMQIL